MRDTIKFRAGKKETMPTLADREVAYCRDENAFYVGTAEGNRKVSPQMEYQPQLESGANAETVVAAYNDLLEKLISSGLMKGNEVIE